MALVSDALPLTPCLAMQCCTCAVYSWLHVLSCPWLWPEDQAGCGEAQPQHRDITWAQLHLSQAGGKQQLALDLGAPEAMEQAAVCSHVLWHCPSAGQGHLAKLCRAGGDVQGDLHPTPAPAQL